MAIGIQRAHIEGNGAQSEPSVVVHRAALPAPMNSVADPFLGKPGNQGLKIIFVIVKLCRNPQHTLWRSRPGKDWDLNVMVLNQLDLQGVRTERAHGRFIA